jgi:hypothetical protein
MTTKISELRLKSEISNNDEYISQLILEYYSIATYTIS